MLSRCLYFFRCCAVLTVLLAGIYAYALETGLDVLDRKAEVIFPDLHGITAIRSVDIVASGNVLHALITGAQAAGMPHGIYYLRSDDAGLHWDAPVSVASAGKPIVRRGNDARLAVAGKKLLAVWQEQGELPGSGPLQSAVSEDGGHSWRIAGYPVQGDATKNQSYASVSADSSGRMHLVWLDDREENGNFSGLRYATSGDNGQRWRQEQTVDPLVCTCCWNRMLALDGRSVAVLYRGADPHDMKLSRLSIESNQWRDAGAVGSFDWRFSGCPHNGGGLALTRAGGQTLLHGVVWTGKDDTGGLYYLYSDDAGTRWSAPYRISDVRGSNGDIAGISSTGRLGIVYSQIDKGRSLIRFRTSRNAGKDWASARTLSSAAAVADHPIIVAVANGFRAFWTEKSGGDKVLRMSVIN